MNILIKLQFHEKIFYSKHTKNYVIIQSEGEGGEKKHKKVQEKSLSRERKAKQSGGTESFLHFITAISLT